MKSSFRAPNQLSRNSLRIPRKPARAALRVSAIFERCTERSIRAFLISQQEAKRCGPTTEVGTHHIVLGLAAEMEPHSYFRAAGLSVEQIRALVQARSRASIWKALRDLPDEDSQGRGSASSRGGFSVESKAAIVKASTECRRAGLNFITPEHIMLAILGMKDCEGRRLLDGAGPNVCEILKREAQRKLKGEEEPGQEPVKRQWVASEPKKPKPPRALGAFCRDLCKEVQAGKVDPVFGRDREVARTIQILARRSKNNPVLLGEPGVGKTAIAEGLAHAIVQRRNPDGSPLPEFLHSKRILQLDVGQLMAGAKERGELENRVTQLVQEAKDAGNVVLMIDELHTLVGAGDTSKSNGGGLDIANMLKPALARGDFQVLGATTLDEHRKHIEQDAALERRFQPVYVDEPSEDQSLHILQGLCARYERHHRVIYSPEALLAAVKLSIKYIQDRQLPDKAIDLLDEAGSRVRIQAYAARKSFKQAESPKIGDYLQVVDMKNEVVTEDLFEEAHILRRREVDYRAELSGSAHEGVSLPLVSPADIEDVVSAWTGVAVERLGEDDKHRLLQLPASLKQRLIGQDEAVDCLAAALMRARCGLKSPNRPVASFLLVGPTGVGKTELVKALAEQYYGSQDALVRLDMSEYMERHSVSRMIGAPPGFQGYEDGGKLTEAVRRRPSCIVLFDEIEKAHPDVFNILLQIMEDGRLTTSQGRHVNFKNTLVILTSNVGSRTIAAGSRGLGTFVRKGADHDEEALHANQARLRSLVLEEVKEHFRPELLNRFDEQVVFQRLSRAHVRQIASIMIKDVQRRVVDLNKGYSLSVGNALLERIISEGYSEEYGVRPLRRAVVKYIDDPLSDALLMRKVPKGCILTVDLDPASGEPVVAQNKECITLDSGEIIITHTANNMEQYNNVVEYSSSKPSPARSSFMKAATRVN